mgnify:CR=1 FL=1
MGNSRLGEGGRPLFDYSEPVDTPAAVDWDGRPSHHVKSLATQAQNDLGYLIPCRQASDWRASDGPLDK